MSEAAVMGATGTVKTMADGTFRLVVDIEPRFAQLAFSLFGAPGTSVALAKITNEAAVAQDRAKQEKQKGGPLAKLAGIWCSDPSFWRWINENRTNHKPVEDAYEATIFVKFDCNIASRSELDHNEEAAEHFHKYIREPFMEWMQNR